MSYGIGDTPLVRSEYLEKRLCVDEIYLKLEGQNPTGTHKDRLAIQHVDDAIIKNYETITVGSCGNYGVSMSFVACRSALDCKIFVPRKYSDKMIERMEHYGAEVIRVEGGYEESVRQSRKMADEKGWYDANPGKENTPISLVAYVDIAEEIQEELDETPSTISVPVGNGTTLAGIHLGFRLLWRKNRSKYVPKMLASTSLGNNAILKTYKEGSEEILVMDPDEIRPTDVNEPLLNWNALNGQEAINAIRETEGTAEGLTDEEMLEYQSMLQDDGINCLPVSASALGALDRYEEKDQLQGKNVIVITSGVRNV